MKKKMKLPKTFVLIVETSDGKKGYLRFRSRMTNGDEIEYVPTLTGKITEASRYVTLENSREKAKLVKQTFGFTSVEVMDETTKKTYVIH